MAKPEADKSIERNQDIPIEVPVKIDQISPRVQLSSNSVNCKNPIPIVVIKSVICK